MDRILNTAEGSSLGLSVLFQFPPTVQRSACQVDQIQTRFLLTCAAMGLMSCPGCLPASHPPPSVVNTISVIQQDK